MKQPLFPNANAALMTALPPVALKTSLTSLHTPPWSAWVEQCQQHPGELREQMQIFPSGANAKTQLM
jgi:hypothetical protein